MTERVPYGMPHLHPDLADDPERLRDHLASHARLNGLVVPDDARVESRLLVSDEETDVHGDPRRMLLATIEVEAPLPAIDRAWSRAAHAAINPPPEPVFRHSGGGGFSMTLVRGPQESATETGHAYHGSADLYGTFDCVLPEILTQGAGSVVITIEPVTP